MIISVFTKTLTEPSQWTNKEVGFRSLINPPILKWVASYLVILRIFWDSELQLKDWDYADFLEIESNVHSFYMFQSSFINLIN